MKTVSIISSHDRVEEYHSLLKSEWSKESFLQSLSLIRKVLDDAKYPVPFDWEENLRALHTLQDFLEKFYYKNTVDPLPNREKGIYSETLYNTQQTAILINIQFISKSLNDIMIEDNQEFLRNLQSLVFSQTLSELLPDLRTVKLQEEYNFLIYSLWLHSVQVWNDDPGHLSYLLGMLGNYIGDSSLAQAGLESNFSSLSSEDHDYLTTAQSLLYYYLDAGDVVRAKDFALNLYRSSPPEHLEEVKEMVDDSFFTGLQPSRKKY